MPARYERLENRRAMIDRKAVAGELAGLEPSRAAMAEIVGRAWKAGRAEIERRIEAAPNRGLRHANAQAFLTDQLVRLIFDFAVQRLYPNPSPTRGERLAICAVGGYGRREMAPFSDVDLMFLTAWKAPWSEQIVEAMLYTLWDLGLKVGHSVRSPGDVVKLSLADATIRTSMLEARFICGDQPLYDAAGERFRAEVVAGTDRDFVRMKLEEREARHKRMGDSRYVVEPNVKEGKGGLRDLHTLFWIGKYIHRAERAAELVDAGLFTPAEYRRFSRADNFLWSVRILLHRLAGRAEERLTFDMQRELASILGYRERDGVAPVERFMRHYFLNARVVGDLTGLFLSQLEETHGRSRLSLPMRTSSPKRLNGFTLTGDRIGIPDEDFFRADPLRLLEMFALADRYEHEVHPRAMRQAAHDAQLVVELRDDARANRLFMDVLTSPRQPDLVLRWMNEAGVFGRFVPDFGRVVARMQYDMYHHFTVDEHTIRAIGLLSRIERGELAGDHPLSSRLIHELASRDVLYAAVLLHDIAKGRGGDHSELGAGIAEELCPRFGLSPAETETVAWLVRYHLLMSATAFKRDLSDVKTIQDFVAEVQSAERLRLLLILTVVDIRAVGPGTWTQWKAQLLRDLYVAAEEVLRLGHQARGRGERIAAKQAALAERLGWDADRIAAYAARFDDSYWVAETLPALVANARQIMRGDEEVSVATTFDPDTGLTQVSVYARDHPGIFFRMAGAISLAGADIVDARVHTTRDGMALDNLNVTAPGGEPFGEPAQQERLRRQVLEAMAGKKMAERLARRPLPQPRGEVFSVEPRVIVQNGASNRFTLVEVNATDRPGLLYALARAFYDARVTIGSAHIATYGERAVDTFYVTDLAGRKIESPQRLRLLERRLLGAAATVLKERRAA